MDGAQICVSHGLDGEQGGGCRRTRPRRGAGGAERAAIAAAIGSAQLHRAIQGVELYGKLLGVDPHRHLDPHCCSWRRFGRKEEALQALRRSRWGRTEGSAWMAANPTMETPGIGTRCHSVMRGRVGAYRVKFSTQVQSRGITAREEIANDSRRTKSKCRTKKMSTL